MATTVNTPRRTSLRRLASPLLLHRVRPGGWDEPAGKALLFRFDYGDEWQFGVRLARCSMAEPWVCYPRMVAGHGRRRRNADRGRRRLGGGR